MDDEGWVTLSYSVTATGQMEAQNQHLFAISKQTNYTLEEGIFLYTYFILVK